MSLIFWPSHFIKISRGIRRVICAMSGKNNIICVNLLIYTYKTWILSVCLSVHVFSQPPKAPASWNFGSRPTLGQLRSLRSPIFKILIFKGASPYGPVFYCRSDKSASVLICLVFILYIWQTCPWTPPACMSRRGVTQSDISLCHFLPDYFYQQTLLRNVRFSHLCDQSCPDDRNSRLFHK